MTDTQNKQKPMLTPEPKSDGDQREGPRTALEDIDRRSLTELYVEFAADDRALANDGLTQYARTLAALDVED